MTLDSGFHWNDGRSGFRLGGRNDGAWILAFRPLFPTRLYLPTSMWVALTE